MKECAVKKTVILIFCSTAYKDPNWIQIRKYFEKKNMDVRACTSIYEGGEDLLSNLVEDLKKEARDEEEANEEKEEEEVEEVDRCDDILARLETMHSYGTGKATRPPEEEIQSEKKCKKSKYRAEYIKQ